MSALIKPFLQETRFINDYRGVAPAPNCAFRHTYLQASE
jgi:hypothetical protein